MLLLHALLLSLLHALLLLSLLTSGTEPHTPHTCPVVGDHRRQGVGHHGCDIVNSPSLVAEPASRHVIRKVSTYRRACKDSVI